MLIVRHLGTPNSDFNGCHCMRDPVLYRSMYRMRTPIFSQVKICLHKMADFEGHF